MLRFSVTMVCGISELGKLFVLYLIKSNQDPLDLEALGQFAQGESSSFLSGRLYNRILSSTIATRKLVCDSHFFRYKQKEHHQSNINQIFIYTRCLSAKKFYLKKTIKERTICLLLLYQGVVFGSGGRFESCSLKPVLKREIDFFLECC